MSAGVSVTNRPPEAGSDELPTRRGVFGRVAVPAAWILVLVAWGGVHVGTGTPWSGLLAWLAVVTLGILLPGFAVVRAVRPATAPLLEDLAWGSAAGCAVALCGWALDVALPLPVPPWVVGPVAAAATLLPATARRRVLARPAPGWGVGPNLVLAGALLVAIAWMTTDFLAVTPPNPGPEGHRYYGDVIYQMALVSEARQSFSMQYPLVSGEPYSYHFFVSAVLAHLGTGNGVDTFDMVLRLAPSSLLVAVVLLAAVVARRLAGRVSAGPIAALLLTVVGTTVATRWSTDGGSGAVVQTYWWASLTAAFGWLAGLAAAGTALAVLRRSPADRAVPTLLFVPFVLLAAGAKSAVLAVLLGGAGLALLVVLVTRQRPLLARAGLVLGVVLATIAGSLLTIYRGSSTGLQVHLFSLLNYRAAGLFPGLVDPAGGRPAMLLVAVAGIFFIPLLLKLAGLVVLLRRQTRDPAVWFIIGALIAGCIGVMVLRHPGFGEVYFLVMAYPIAVVGSAWGISLLLASRPDGSPWRAAAAIGAGVGVLATIVIAWVAGPTPPMVAWISAHGHRPPTAAEVGTVRQVLWWTGPLLVLAAVVVGVTILAYLAARISAGRRRAGWLAAVPVLLVTAVLGTGLFGTLLFVTGGSTAPSLGRAVPALSTSLTVTSDELTAGRWLDDHAAAQDVLAVNRVCLEPQTSAELPRPCTAMFFTTAATAQRTTEVGAWAYASRNVDEAWTSGVHYPLQPFWDPPRLRRELRAFTDPTDASLAELYRDGVRWLVADQGGAPANVAALDRLADRRLSLPTVTVWQLRPPR